MIKVISINGFISFHLSVRQIFTECSTASGTLLGAADTDKGEEVLGFIKLALCRGESRDKHRKAYKGQVLGAVRTGLFDL